MSMKKLAKIISLCFASSLLFGCANTVVIHEDIVDPADIVLNDKQITLSIGETYQIEASFVINGSNQNVTFSYKSLNTEVATVSSTGLVEAIKVGEAIIQVTYDKYKTLLKVNVEEGQESSLLGLIIHEEFISLYEDEQYTVRYDVRLNGQPIDIKAAYSNYDTSIISIENDIITAKGIGSTIAKIRVTYGDNIAEESFTVRVNETKYYLSCNYEDNQVVVGEEDLEVTYSLNFGRNSVKTLHLSELNSQIPETEIATINGNYITGIKKGSFDLHVSYLIPDTGDVVSSIDGFRCRERYIVKSIDLDNPIYVLNDDKIDYVPVNSNPNLVFDSWLKDGATFDEPVEDDLLLGVRWKINEINFAVDIRGAKSIAPSEGETIEAKYYNDDADYANGLKYDLSKNCHDGVATEDIVANIYLPKMDYREVSKVTYLWKTNGYVTVDLDHWYAGAMAIGGTIDITYDGHYLTQTITQTYDVKDPFSGVSYKGVSRTLISDDINVIQGNENLKSIYYWAYESIITTSCIYLSNPKTSISHDYLPYYRLGNYTGTIFSTSDPNAHYDSESKMPTIVQYISDTNEPNNDYLYYYQDRAYDEAKGWIHCRADYTLTLPAIDFSSLDKGISMPYEIEGGFYVGFDENKITTPGKGIFKFDYVKDSGLSISICSEIGEKIYSYNCLDSNVISGNKGFTFPVCYSTHCFQRGLMLYQPRFTEKCVTHLYKETLVTDKIGYFGTVCKICGEAGPLSDNLMRYNDIDFAVAQYGAMGGKWGSFVQPTAKTMTFENVEKAEEVIISLPKINFSIYNIVKFNVSGNVWDVRVGLESDSYPFPYDASKAHSGTLTFITHDDVVDVTLSCLEGTTQNLTITDSDIINGNKSFELYMIADDLYRSATIELTALQDVCEHNYVVSTEKIGVKVCSICGDEIDYKSSMNEIDFSNNQYGSEGGKWAASTWATEKEMTYEVTAGDTENIISLPKINFKAFSSVQFNVTCGSFAIGAGLKSGEYILPGSASSSDVAHTGVLTFTMNGNNLEVTLSCNETSQTQSIIITDARVINGDVSASLYMYSINYAWQMVTIELIALN